MIKVKKEGVILSPTKNVFESRAVLNPAVYQDGDKVHVIYRAIAEDYVSCLGYARLNGPTEVADRWERPFMAPKLKVECKGIEDPRLVKIEDSFYLTYVVHDGKNAVSAFSCGTDLFKLVRGHVISPKIPYKEAEKIFRFTKLKDEYYFFEAFYQEFGGKNVLIWHKDCVLFPEKVGDQFQMLHRVLPDVQLVSFDDFSELKDKYFWINHLMNLGDNVVLESIHGFEARHVGGGAPPVKTDKGWLMIYHAAQEMNKKRVYHAGAALLDLEDPRRVIARLPYPLFSPTEKFEIEGTVNDVVFPTGTSLYGGDLYIYYGAADSKIAVAKVGMADLLEELWKHRVKTEE